MRGNLIAHVFGPKAVQVMCNIYLSLRLVGIRFEKVAHLVGHFDEGFGLHDFNLIALFFKVKVEYCMY